MSRNRNVIRVKRIDLQVGLLEVEVELQHLEEVGEVLDRAEFWRSICKVDGNVVGCCEW